MICLYCNKETSNPKFCNTSCSASYNNYHRTSRTIESRIKSSISCSKNKIKPDHKTCEICGIKFYKFQSKGKKYCTQKCSGLAARLRIKADFTINGKGNHKKVLLQERGHKCEKCKNTNWLGIPISLQLEHKDGNHNNNEKTNLELLCPNCHSQTLTYNRRKSSTLVTDELFLKTLKNTKNVHQCLCILHLNKSSANYARAKRLLSINNSGPIA